MAFSAAALRSSKAVPHYVHCHRHRARLQGDGRQAVGVDVPNLAGRHLLLRGTSSSPVERKDTGAAAIR